MLKKFFIRDRMVMIGLVVLGIATVAAGFVSGRSTFQYALATDARQASIQWVRQTEEKLIFSGDENPSGKRDDVVVVSQRTFGEFRSMAEKEGRAGLMVGRSVSKESGLMAGIDRLISGWITRLTRFLDSESHVSLVDNFALLDAKGNVVLRSGGLSPAALGDLLARSDIQKEIYKSLGNFSVRLMDDFALPGNRASEFQKAIIVPLVRSGKVTRVYLLSIDQSSAATMSKVALIAASMMTSLLIVLGYSVPAAVAFRRIREKWKAEDKIRFLAMHDPLTGLSNRVQLNVRAEQAIARAKRGKKQVAIMCIDLDRFKEVNDTLGHEAGDSLLKEAADRLRECVRETDVVARVGGDEFVVLAEDILTSEDSVPVARRICERLSEVFKLGAHEIAISCSVGISLSPSEGDDVQALLNNADLALYRAKNDGRNTFRFFEPEMDKAIQRRRSLANDLRTALKNNGLEIHYQPQFDLGSGALTGYEALARWPHPEHGSIPPDQFIPIAEESGLIATLGEWVLDTACHYARHWPAGTTLSVNISAAQFVAQDLSSMVRAVLEKSKLEPGRLLLEFKEDLLFRNTDETITTLKQLTSMGVGLALDDFGTGYSSLGYLTRLPVSKIKIDQSFVRQMDQDKDIGAIVNTIVLLGKSLNMTITAEGVETEEQAAYLRNVGCTEVQGYLFGRPDRQVQNERPGIIEVEENVPAPAPQAAPEAPPAPIDEKTVELDTRPPVMPQPEPEYGTSELSGRLPENPASLRSMGRLMRGSDPAGQLDENGNVAPPKSASS